MTLTFQCKFSFNIHFRYLERVVRLSRVSRKVRATELPPPPNKERKIQGPCMVYSEASKNQYQSIFVLWGPRKVNMKCLPAPQKSKYIKVPTLTLAPCELTYWSVEILHVTNRNRKLRGEDP